MHTDRSIEQWKAELGELARAFRDYHLAPGYPHPRRRLLRRQTAQRLAATLRQAITEYPAHQEHLLDVLLLNLGLEEPPPELKIASWRRL